MNGYVEAGYSVGLGGLAVYATSLAMRVRASRQRLAEAIPASVPPPAGADEPTPPPESR